MNFYAEVSRSSQQDGSRFFHMCSISNNKVFTSDVMAAMKKFSFVSVEKQVIDHMSETPYNRCSIQSFQISGRVRQRNGGHFGVPD